MTCRSDLQCCLLQTSVGSCICFYCSNNSLGTALQIDYSNFIAAEEDHERFDVFLAKERTEGEYAIAVGLESTAFLREKS